LAVFAVFLGARRLPFWATLPDFGNTGFGTKTAPVLFFLASQGILTNNISILPILI
jgi:hypothetical protein